VTKRKTYLASAAILTLGAVSMPSAQAKFAAVYKEFDSSVVETGSGSLDLTDLGMSVSTFKLNPAVVPESGLVAMGTPGAEVNLFNNGLIMGPGRFGLGLETDTDLSTGDAVSASLEGIAVLQGYPSGASLFNTSNYADASFSSLGMTPGTYVYTWGTGVHADSFTIDIVASPSLPVPEPSTWAMMLIGFAGLGYAALRRDPRVTG
jgi:hypothetical protein